MPDDLEHLRAEYTARHVRIHEHLALIERRLAQRVYWATFAGALAGGMLAAAITAIWS